MRYFTHDTDMRNDLKIRGLRKIFGTEGYAVWCYLLEVLTDSRDLSINYKQSQLLLASDFDLSPDRLDEIVKFCEGVGLLQFDGDILYSTAHQERIAKIQHTHEARSNAAQRAAQQRWNSDAETMPTQCEGNADAMPTQCETMRSDAIREEKNRIEKKREEKKRELPSELPEKIADLWNDICVSMPMVTRLSDARRAKVKSRLREWGKDADEMLAKAREIFTRMEASDFLCGRTGKWTGATFDWLFGSRENWIKVSEGNYDNRNASTANADGSAALGAGEYFTAEDHRRTYGSGKATVPNDAPPRPSERHTWNAINQQWVLL